MTRKRRYLISAAVLVACVCITLGVLTMLPPRPGVTKANFDRIEKGMTYAAVREILGKEPVIADKNKTPERSTLFIGWAGDNDAFATITFNDDVVSEMRWQNSDESLFDKLRRWRNLPK